MYYACMTVSLQIRDVPEVVRDGLAQRARQRGQSMQAYLLELVTSDHAYARNIDTFKATQGTRTQVDSDVVMQIVAEGREAGAQVNRGLLR